MRTKKNTTIKFALVLNNCSLPDVSHQTAQWSYYYNRYSTDDMRANACKRKTHVEIRKKSSVKILNFKHDLVFR